MGVGTALNQCNCFNVRTLAPQVTGLSLSQSPGQITGSFNGVDAAWPDLVKGYRVVYKAGGIPTGINDGTALNIQPQRIPIYAFTVPATNGVLYGVRVFVEGPGGFQTSEIAQGTMTPVAGLKLGDMAIGTLLDIPLTDGTVYQMRLIAQDFNGFYKEDKSGLPSNAGVAFGESIYGSIPANTIISGLVQVIRLVLSAFYSNLTGNIKENAATTTLDWTGGSTYKTNREALTSYILSDAELGNQGVQQGIPYFNSNAKRMRDGSYLTRNVLDITNWSPSYGYVTAAGEYTSAGGALTTLVKGALGVVPALSLKKTMLFNPTPKPNGAYSPI